MPIMAKFCMYCSSPVNTTHDSNSSRTYESVKKSHIKRNTLIIVLIMIFIGLIMALPSEEYGEENSVQTNSIEIIQDEELEKIPNIILLDYEIVLGEVEIDKLNIVEAEIRLKNTGNKEGKVTELAIFSKKEHTMCKNNSMLDPNEEATYSFQLFNGSLSKAPGIDYMNLTLKVLGPFESNFAYLENNSKVIYIERDFKIEIPKTRIGDTIANVTPRKDEPGLNLTILWWKESNIAVKQWSENSYFTFRSKPNMKFVILAYEIRNDWIREQSVNWGRSGEIATNKGYIYSSWFASLNDKEYDPRSSEPHEIRELIGNSGSYERLLPEESIKGCIIFEIPKDDTPVEGTLYWIPGIIEY